VRRCAGIEEGAKELTREFTEVNDRGSDAGSLFKTKQIRSGYFLTVPYLPVFLSGVRAR
jgi:hypothetical protein